MPLIHIVQKGDTIESIAKQFKISKQRLMEENELSPNSTLNIGQVILIAYPTQTYIVKDGDSLYSIARENGVTVMELLQNNPSLADQNYLEVGKELVLSYGAKERSVQVNGMTYSFIDERVLRKTLPYLTYITVMGYLVDEKGNFNDLDDITIVQTSIDYGVVPLMLISTLTVTGQGSPEVTHAIFNNQELQNTMIDNIITIMSAKGYHGAVFGFQYILEEDIQKYTDFIVLASERFKAEGYLSGAVLLPDTFGYTQGEPYQQTYFSRIGQSVDLSILLSYQWSTGYIPAAYQIGYAFKKEYLDVVIKQVPADKIYLGVSRVAYDWELPYKQGESFASSLTYPSAIALANQNGSEILFDENSKLSYFNYRLLDQDHTVWVIDARYIRAIFTLVDEYNLGGISIWTIMYFYRIYLLINLKYDIEKLLPVE